MARALPISKCTALAPELLRPRPSRVASAVFLTTPHPPGSAGSAVYPWPFPQQGGSGHPHPPGHYSIFLTPPSHRQSIFLTAGPFKTMTSLPLVKPHRTQSSAPDSLLPAQTPCTSPGTPHPPPSHTASTRPRLFPTQGLYTCLSLRSLGSQLQPFLGSSAISATPLMTLSN